jgi:hypothetical protein
LCVLIFKTDCVSLFLSILPIVQFSDGRGYEIEPFFFFINNKMFFHFLAFQSYICRFSSVTERFFMELNTRRIDTSAARSETLSIINGMRYLKLGVCIRIKLNVLWFLNSII